jgi:integrase
MSIIKTKPDKQGRAYYFACYYHDTFNNLTHYHSKRYLLKKDAEQAANEKAASLPHIRIHDFRHSCASLLINNGASIILVSKYLGHSNISTTLNTYSHLYKNQFDEIVNTIDNLDKK